tara:strand:- start:1054 stop:1284 length:231 start_codon:yes stop_codon:yes gene_type:complete
MSKQIIFRYDWNEFKNYEKLNGSQRAYLALSLRKLYRSSMKDSIQQAINDVIHFDQELEAHRDKEVPFRIDIGGEG